MGQTARRRQRLYRGDCLKVLRDLPANSVDSVVTDPPYHLTSIVKRFAKTSLADDTTTSDRARQRADGMARLSRGFMGKTWDGGDIAFRPDVWREVYRVLKPGAHLLAFGGTRTYHRLACAIEDAGFEIRDCVMWVYGSGFPKSLNVSKAIDKALGVEREVVGSHPNPAANKGGGNSFNMSIVGMPKHAAITAPATDAARQWAGYGTALKPACEPIVLARKPLIGSVAENVLAHGTGAINVDGCRIGTEQRVNGPTGDRSEQIGAWGMKSNNAGSVVNGRWPANLIHDGSAEVVEAFPESQSPQPYNRSSGSDSKQVYGTYASRDGQVNASFGDSGSAARFFYCAKSSRADRNVGGVDNKHPTVKPTTLMRYLCRLVTPPNGVILDPFMGSGSTGRAAKLEGFRFIGIEREQEYMRVARRRIAASKGDTPCRSRRRTPRPRGKPSSIRRCTPSKRGNSTAARSTVPSSRTASKPSQSRSPKAANPTGRKGMQ